MIFSVPIISLVCLSKSSVRKPTRACLHELLAGCQSSSSCQCVIVAMREWRERVLYVNECIKNWTITREFQMIYAPDDIRSSNISTPRNVASSCYVNLSNWKSSLICFPPKVSSRGASLWNWLLNYHSWTLTLATLPCLMTSSYDLLTLTYGFSLMPGKRTMKD